MSSFVVVAVLATLAVAVQAQTPPPPSSPPPPVCLPGSQKWGPNCVDCACAFGAACSDGNNGTGCKCPPHTSGATCSTCFPNWSPEFDCQKEINPCISCLTANANDCTQAIKCPNHAGCYNNGLVGNKQCKCYKGYEKTPQYGVPGLPQGNCPDIDECAKFKNACPVQATCTNQIGSYNCTCKAGYVPLYNSAVIPRYCVRPRRARSLMQYNFKLAPQIEVSYPEDSF